MRGRRFNAVEYKTNDKNRTGNYHSRGTQVLPLNEKKRIIDGSNELIADFLPQMVLFLDYKQPRPCLNPK